MTEFILRPQSDYPRLTYERARRLHVVLRRLGVPHAHHLDLASGVAGRRIA